VFLTSYFALIAASVVLSIEPHLQSILHVHVYRRTPLTSPVWDNYCFMSLKVSEWRRVARVAFRNNGRSNDDGRH